MAKKDKSAKKKAERRERAKLRAEGVLPEVGAEQQEQAADEAVARADKAVPTESKARVKRAPKAQKEEETENAWQRMSNFFKEVKIETLKINWPASDDTWKSTWVTVFVIIFLSVFMGFASLGFKQVSEILFGHGQQTQTAQTTNTGTADVPIGLSGLPVDTTEEEGTGTEE